MSVNLVVASGIVKSMALRYATDGKPELRWTLDQHEGAFHLWLPCTASGSAAERLASEIEDGQHIVVTSGKLCYRKRTTKLGEQSRLEVLVWSVDILTGTDTLPTSDAPEYDSGSDHGALLVEPASVPEPKKTRQPRIPKASRLTWQPEHAN